MELKYYNDVLVILSLKKILEILKMSSLLDMQYIILLLYLFDKLY